MDSQDGKITDKLNSQAWAKTTVHRQLEKEDHGQDWIPSTDKITQIIQDNLPYLNPNDGGL